MSRKIIYRQSTWRFTTLMVLLFVIGHLSAQQIDTIDLHTVEIHALKEPGKPIFQEADSLLSSKIYSAKVEQLLEKFSPMLIRAYGGSGSAMATYQGFSPSQVPVLWNGIPSRSGITGVSDLSLFSLSPLQHISWGNGSLVTQGMTGALSMDQAWNSDSFLLRSSFSSGSFGLLQGSVMQQKLFKNGGIQFFGTGARAKNDYNYTNYTVIPETKEQQSHAKMSKVTLSQGWRVNSKDKRHQLQGIVEGYFNKREIPPTLLSPDNKANQQDGGFRSFVDWNYTAKNWKNSMTVAWMYSSLLYNDLTLVKSSDNKGSLLWLKEKAAKEWAHVAYSEIGMDIGLDRVKSSNYSGVKSEWQINPYVLQKYTPARWINIVLQVKGILLQGHHHTITIMGGIDGRPAKDVPLRYFVSARKNVRFPSLNDKYWQPGGNPDIREEKSVNIEGGWQLDKLKWADKWQLSALVKGYFTKADDLIFWFPGNKVFWSPQNLLKVNSKGMEADIHVRYTHHQLSWASGFIFQYTSIVNKKAVGQNDFSVGKQLLYIPKYSAKNYGLIAYKGFMLMADLQYYPLRYITSDNSSYLPGYALLSIQTGYTLTLKKSHSLELLFGINNATNKTYEEIAYRPLPGINFTGTIIYQLTK